jgi:hypothetical protein
MAAQVPAIVYFAITVVPRAPRQGSVVLGVQVLAAVLAAAPVRIFGW